MVVQEVIDRRFDDNDNNRRYLARKMQSNRNAQEQILIVIRSQTSTPSQEMNRQPVFKSFAPNPLAPRNRSIQATTLMRNSAGSRTMSMISSKRSSFQWEHQHQDGETHRRVLTQPLSSKPTPMLRCSSCSVTSRIAEETETTTTEMVSFILRTTFSFYANFIYRQQQRS